MAKMKDTWAEFKKRPDPLTSIALTIPVFLIYQLCILLVNTRSGVDVVTDTLLSMLDEEYYPVYVVVTLLLALGLATVTWVEERRGASTSVSLTKVVLEGLGYSLLVLAILGWAPRRFLRTTEQLAAEAPGVLESMVLSAGTGLHQEVIFRAILVTALGGLMAMVFRVSKRVALGIAVTLSSITFALTHNYGTHGEPFMPDIAFYHMVLGGLFAGVYLLRGFAVAVYAHVFFEIGVRFLRA
jgi:hypothetical protein